MRSVAKEVRRISLICFERQRHWNEQHLVDLRWKSVGTTCEAKERIGAVPRGIDTQRYSFAVPGGAEQRNRIGMRRKAKEMLCIAQNSKGAATRSVALTSEGMDALGGVLNRR